MRPSAIDLSKRKHSDKKASSRRRAFQGIARSLPIPIPLTQSPMQAEEAGG